MKVEKDKNSLLIVPETEFETDVLREMFPNETSAKAFIKCGLTPADVIGLKIVSCSTNDGNNDIVGTTYRVNREKRRRVSKKEA